MSYLVTCTFDLKNATSRDYQNAYTELEGLGLKRVVVSGQGREVVAPTTMTIGTFTGRTAAAVQEHIRNLVKAAFATRGFSSEIFVTVGDNWAWGAGST
jgi:hypothetical protein